MAFTLKPIAEQVIVITGASSGIGLATAVEACRRGASVVLAARNRDALDRIVERIGKDGGTAIAVEADVGQRDEVQRIRDMAIERFGRIDTWVNDAGVDIWGRLDEVSDEDSRRLFETNFWGTVHGSRIAVDALRKEGGALINVGSIASDRAFPLQGMYSASKHAVKAFTEALRTELEAEGTPISVTLVKPSSIGTPLQAQARNYLDHEPRLPSPLYAPEAVAEAILHAAVRPVRDIYIGSAGRALALLGTIAPRITDAIARSALIRSQLRRTEARPREDNLHDAGPRGGTISADPENRMPRRSLYTRAVLHMPRYPVGLAIAWTAAGVGAAAVVRAALLRRS